MSNDLTTNFVFNDNQLNKVDALERRLSDLGKRFDEVGTNSNFGKKLNNDFASVGNQINTTVRKFSDGQDALMKNALADIKRFQKENERAEKEITKSIEREAKLQADAKIREGKRAANEALKTLNSDRKNPVSSLASDFVGEFVLPSLSFAAAGAAFKTSLDASREASNAQRLLRSTTIETGIAYNKLSESARKFGEDTLQSNRAAQSSFSQIANFANAAGRADKLEEFREKFADLAAAKGIDPKNLGDISRQLNALTDEATDKLLNANPSAFYDSFAKSIGKTANSLTDAEKRAAVFDEVLKKGALFSGEAEKRANASASALDRLSVKFENLKEKAGGASVSVVEFGEFLTKVVTADPSLYSTPKRSNGLLSEQDLNSIAARLREQDKKIGEAIAKPFAGAINNELSKINLADNFFDVEKRQKAIDAAVKTGEEVAKSFKTAFEANIADKNISVGLAKLAQRQFYQNQSDYDPQTRRALAEQLEQSVKDAEKREADAAKKIADKRTEEFKKAQVEIKKLSESANQTFANLSQKINSDNPFVSIFADARTELEKLKESLKGLPSELQNSAVSSQQVINRNRLFGARLDNALSTLDLRETANRFRSFTEKDKRTEDETIRLLAQSGIFGGKTGDSNLNAFANALAGRRFVSDDQSVSQRLQKQLDVINSFGATGEQRAIADAKILSIASNLDPSQINQTQREQIAASAERRAERQEKYFADALKIEQEKLNIQKRIADNGEKLLKVAEEKGLNGLNDYLEITVKGGDVQSVTGSTGTQEDVRNTYFNEAN